MDGWTAALQHGLERKQPDRTLHWTAVQHCSFCLDQEAASQASCQGCIGRGRTYQKSQGSKASSAQKSIPHLQYQFRCEETQHKGLTLMTAKSHTSLLNFRAQQLTITFWWLILDSMPRSCYPHLPHLRRFMTKHILLKTEKQDLPSPSRLPHFPYTQNLKLSLLCFQRSLLTNKSSNQ